MNLEVPLSASAPMRKPLFYNPVFKTLAVAVVVVLVAALCAVIPRAVAQERCAGSYTDLKWKDGSEVLTELFITARRIRRRLNLNGLSNHL